MRQSKTVRQSKIVRQSKMVRQIKMMMEQKSIKHDPLILVQLFIDRPLCFDTPTKEHQPRTFEDQIDNDTEKDRRSIVDIMYSLFPVHKRRPFLKEQKMIKMEKTMKSYAERVKKLQAELEMIKKRSPDP